MQMSYFKWSNAIDLAIYMLSLIFVYPINFLENYPFGPGCQDQDQVNKKIQNHAKYQHKH